MPALIILNLQSALQHALCAFRNNSAGIGIRYRNDGEHWSQRQMVSNQNGEYEWTRSVTSYLRTAAREMQNRTQRCGKV